MPVLNRIADLAPEVTAWRRDIHAHPELGFAERRTSALVAEKLAAWGIEVTTGIAGTGLVGTLRNGDSPRAIGLRADMDALPMEEINQFAHRSTSPGVMHACGHDGHTAMLLGAAKYLAETRNFDGTVHFIFQPAEEGGGGGRVMVEEGLFERFPCEAVYGAHNDPAVPVGTMVVMEGALNAFADRFWIRVRGRGGHAARPHHAIDPVVVGSAGNVIPFDATLNGTVRTLKPAVQDEIERQMGEIVRSIAAAHGAEGVLEYHRGYPQVVNAAKPTESAARAAARIVGEEHLVRRVPPRMGGEDFSYMANAVPGCFVRIGQGGKSTGRTPAHHPEYDFNDEILPIGASYWASLVEQELARS
jgi:hippurate hydrolase